MEYDFPMHLSPSYKTLQLKALLLSSIHHLLLPFPTTMGVFQGNYLLWYYFIHKYFSTHLKMMSSFLNIIKTSLFSCPPKKVIFSNVIKYPDCVWISLIMCLFLPLGSFGNGSKQDAQVLHLFDRFFISFNWWIPPPSFFYWQFIC